MDKSTDGGKGGYTWIYIYLLCFLFFYLLFTFVIGISAVSGHSMEDTLRNGTFIMVYKTYSKIERYNIVTLSGEPCGNAVKRVIGLPGETVSINDNIVFIDGMPLGGSSDTHNCHIWFLGDDEYFVMGDNRGGSFDSRKYGAVSSSNITGIVLGKHDYR